MNCPLSYSRPDEVQGPIPWEQLKWSSYSRAGCGDLVEAPLGRLLGAEADFHRATEEMMGGLAGRGGELAVVAKSDVGVRTYMVGKWDRAQGLFGCQNLNKRTGFVDEPG